MTTIKNLGIWMDHASAHLIELTTNEPLPKRIESKFTHDEKGFTLNKSEKGMHNKEQQQQLTYYKEIADIIKKFTNVILFGPAGAKNELINMLKEDHSFNTIKIEVLQADNMTENQEYAFVKEYFSKHKYL